MTEKRNGKNRIGRGLMAAWPDGWWGGPGRRVIQKLRDLFQEEDGMGTVEVVLIIVVLVGLVIIFQEQIQGLVESVFAAISQKKDTIVNY